MATSFKSLLKPKTSPILGTNAIFALPKTTGVSVDPVVPMIPVSGMSKTSTQGIVLQPPKPTTTQPAMTVQPPAPPIAQPIAKQVVRPPVQQAPVAQAPAQESPVPPPQQEAPVVPPPVVQQDTPTTPGATSGMATPDTSSGESFAKYLDGTAATYKAPVDKYASEIDSMIGGEADQRLKKEIQDEIQQEFRNIERKYAEERAIAERESANRFQEQMSSLAGVGFNPLSSGSNNLTAANTAVLERFKSNLAAQELEEKSAVAARINNTKTTAFRNRLDDLRTAQDSLKKDADAELARDRNRINDIFQNALSALTIQKTKRDLSTSEKNEQFSRVKDLLGVYGSSILTNMSDVDLRALEASSGLPAGSLNAGSKTLKDIEIAAKSQLTEVSPGASLYDPVTGQGVYTAPERSGTAPDRKIVKIDGMDYVQNEDGTYSRPDVPTSPTSEKVSRARSVIDSINDIVNDPKLSNAVGPKSVYVPGILRSGARNDVDAKIDSLIANLALENLTLLKGPMSDKDIVFIKEASSGLKKNMSEEGFMERLEKLRVRFEQIEDKAELKQQFPNMSDEEIQRIVDENSGVSFNKPLSTGGKGSIPKENVQVKTALGNGIITGYGSKFWKAGLDFVLPGGKNADVKVPYDAVVLSVDPEKSTGGFGNRVKIRTADGREVWLSHLSSATVKPGQRLAAGQSVGKQGNTGRTYGKTGIHVDITMPKPGGGYYTAEDVARYINAA
jgi:murein DD-endopeptidase MepM/ murein hydrolase activator NlpD